MKDANSTTIPPKTDEPAPKADEAKKEEPKKEDAKKDDKPALTGAPEKYEPFTAPEGYELSEELVTAATELFKEMNLSQVGSQKLVDFYNEQLVKATEAPYDQYVDTRKGWRAEMAKDPELGNGKDDLKPEVKADLEKTIKALPEKLQPQFREAMVLTGAGDNPAFVRAFKHLSQYITEGTVVKGGGPSSHGQNPDGKGSAANAAQTMYPGLPSANSPR